MFPLIRANWEVAGPEQSQRRKSSMRQSQNPSRFQPSGSGSVGGLRSDSGASRGAVPSPSQAVCPQICKKYFQVGHAAQVGLREFRDDVESAEGRKGCHSRHVGQRLRRTTEIARRSSYQIIAGLRIRNTNDLYHPKLSSSFDRITLCHTATTT